MTGSPEIGVTSVAGGEPDVLRSPEAGGLVIRGTAVRVAGYCIGILIGLAVSVLLLRHLGVAEFGRYVTVTALLGIVAGVTDAGLTAVGARELSLRTSAAERDRVLGSLIALRLIITPVGVALAVGFAVVAGYDGTLVAGTVLGGLGVILVNLQATAMTPLAVELRLRRLTCVEVLRNVVTLTGVFLLVVAGATLLPFFAVQITVGVVVLAVTPTVLGRGARLRPTLDWPMWRQLARDALPVAVALAMNVIYFRVLVVEMSLIAAEDQVGFFATSFRTIEVLLTLPVVILSTALPVLAVAHDADRERLRYGVQRLTEIAVLVAIPVILALAIPATPLVQLLGGSQYAGAGQVLTVQSLSLLALFLGQAWQIVLIAMRLQRGVAIANAVALAAVMALGVALIPAYGALGAAWAAVIGESVLALCLLGALAAAGRDMIPRVRFAGRVLIALMPAIVVALIPGLPRFGAAALSVALFAAAAMAIGAVPGEIVHAFRPRLARLARGGR